jgi:hypothetical protein
VAKANAARTEKQPVKDDKWKSASRVLKRRADEKKKLAVPKIPRAGNWKPVTIQDGDAEDEEIIPIKPIKPIPNSINPSNNTAPAR